MTLQKPKLHQAFAMLCFIAFTGAHSIAFAQPSDGKDRISRGASTGQAMTLEDLITEALEHNPEIQVAAEEVDASRGGLVTARKWENPELSLTPSIKRIPSSAEGSGDTSFKGIFQLGQLIEFPGKRTLRRAIAEKDVAVSEMAREGLRYQLRVQVKRTFYKFLAAEEIQKLRYEQVKGAEVFVGVTRKRTESGYASDVEAVRAQADLILAQKNLKEANFSVSEALIGLNQLLGRDPLTKLNVAGTLEQRTVIPSQSNLLDLALRENPSLKSQKLGAEKAGLSVEAAKLSARPDLTIGPSVEYSDDEQIYGISASLPLPLWDRKTGEIQSASAERRKALAEFEKLQLEIRSAIAGSIQKVRAANEQMALFTPQFRKQLKTSMEQAESSYAATGTSVLLYLDAKRTYFETLSSYYEALLQNADARAELEAAVGVPIEQTTTKP